MSQDWNDRFDYLRRSHVMSLNDDYLGFSAAEARTQIERERRFTDAFRAYGRASRTLVAPAMMFSYGRVRCS